MTYQIWAYTQAGEQVAVLENAFNIQRIKKANSVPSLSFSLPVDDAKAVYLTTAYELKVWNTLKSRLEGLYTLDDATEKWDSSGSVIAVNYSGAMVQLVAEDNITYDTTRTPKTPTQIVTALLALQEQTPAITVGTIQPTTAFAMAIENTNILAALLKCVDYLGGYIEVDEDRHLNWYNEPSGSPVREIRYQKNMKGVTRKRDFTNIVNKLYAYGYGETEAQVTLAVDALIFTYSSGSTRSGDPPAIGCWIFPVGSLTYYVISDLTTVSGSWDDGDAAGTITAIPSGGVWVGDWIAGNVFSLDDFAVIAHTEIIIQQYHDEEYIEDTTSQTAYGIKIKRITDKRITHPSTLLLWAQRVLTQFKDPIYYYTVGAVNLAEHPDFSFDIEELEIGQIVRVINSDLNLNVNVKIVSLTTNLSRPEEITLELANATKTLSDSIGGAASNINLVQNVAVQIGAGQVTVQGVFTVDGWRSSGLTTIDGGKITANSITVNQLNFTPVSGDNVIATINASAEGITITAARIAIDGTTTFSSGYDPVMKAKVFAQDAVPTSISIGDLWIDTNDGNRLYRANAVGVSTVVTTGNGWYLVRDDGIAAALEAAATAQETADGEIVGFYQDTEPASGMAFGDIWIDTDGHTPLTTADIYRYEDPDGGSSGTLAWRAAATNAIGIVYLNAYSAQSTANSKIKTFYQPGIPTSLEAGDLWVDTDDKNKLYRAAIAGADAITAGEWETIRDSDIAQAIADASAAAGAAATAQGDATTALGKLSDMAADSKITPPEKLVAKPEWDIIDAEETGIVAQADAFSVSHVDYSASFAALDTYLNTTLVVFGDMAATTTITRATWDTKWNDYYSDRTDLLNAIATKAKDIADGKITAGGAAADINNNATTISGGKITTNTIDADAIKTSTLNAKTITLGTTGGDSIIKSGNYYAGYTGWQIKANGDAEFNNVVVRGTIAACTISSGNTLTVVGAIESYGYAHESTGWKLSGDGVCDFLAIVSYNSITCTNGSVAGNRLVSHTTLVLDSNVSDGDADNGSLYTNDGLNLCWKDDNGRCRTILVS